MRAGSELLRLVDIIQREKNIDKESVFVGLEQALLAAVRKRMDDPEDVSIEICRTSGEIVALDGDEPIDPAELGRIAALTAKQVMMQKFREAERDVVFEEYGGKIGEMITGIVQRAERPNVIISLGRVEALLPGREQPAGESYHVGERLKALIIDVRKVGQRVRIVCSRSSPEIVRSLFELEVPEIQGNVVELKAIARDAGYRTKVAVTSNDPKVDAVGACVGIRGSRIRNIVDELNGEKIDIVRFADTPELFIMNALKPAELHGIELDYEQRKALVFVGDDQLALAIGKRGQNVRLAAKLTGWAVDIVTGTPENYIEKFVTSRPLEEVQAERARQVAKSAAALDGKVSIPIEGSLTAATRTSPPVAASNPFEVAANASLFKPIEAKSAALEALISNAPAVPAPWLSERATKEGRQDPSSETEVNEQETEVGEQSPKVDEQPVAVDEQSPEVDEQPAPVAQDTAADS